MEERIKDKAVPCAGCKTWIGVGSYAENIQGGMWHLRCAGLKERGQPIKPVREARKKSDFAFFEPKRPRWVTLRGKLQDTAPLTAAKGL